ncbi:Hypothetical predicted protein [Mytilus galloprovincialis]|uniref:Uncharacterized protein n=1 Tax=Mytilus galloprovincialis TaxID=29158 RepID=A0A8B6CEN1_MYTGA|nr:Hypothetical predicted protein [Mytilus galloprovincialis]
MVMRLCTGDCPGEFTCGENECIPYSLVCNGNIDCQNEHSIAYEEYYVCLIEGCNENFKCDDGTCIPFEKLCDSHSDCAGGEDETRCYISGLVCPGGSKCKNGMCIPADWMCDGTPHCHDESDESPTTCNPEEFTTQVMEASTNSSNEDQPKRETKEQSRYQTTSPMHQSNDTNGGESGIENSSASVSGGGVLMGNNGDVLRSSMNNG